MVYLNRAIDRIARQESMNEAKNLKQYRYKIKKTKQFGAIIQ
jgi:hypothetical protein